MKGLNRSAVLAALLLVGACATNVDMVPTNGSRADGTIDMSFQYGIFQKPIVDTDKAMAQAQETCHGWGYTGARPFGGSNQTCLVRNGYGNCLRVQVDVRFQCTGSPSTG